jgi:choline dehydrogenase-like flavoprotein
MSPAIPGLPAAEAEVPAARAIAAYVAALPPPVVRVIRLGLIAFERLPFPRRFSRLAAEERRRRLAGMAASRSALRRDLLQLMKTLALVGYASDERVRIAVGYEARCELEEGARPAAPPAGRGAGAIEGAGALGDLTPDPEGEECDVAIVGSGAGGAVAAAILAEAGLDVLVLESGPHMTRETYPSDPLEALTALYRDGGLTVATGRPAIPVPAGRAVGGTTVINSGTCFRAPERVTRAWHDELGIGWASELEAEFAEAEEMLAVRTLELDRIGRNGQLVAEGASALSYSGRPLSRNAGACVQCSSCPQGCRLDAKRGMHVSYLPRAVAAGARVRSGIEARRVVFEAGRAAGLECVLRVPAAAARRTAGSVGPPGAGGPLTVRARRAVVAAGGAFGTPELLLRSGVEHPELGRNLRIHPAAWVGARFDREVRGWEGVMQSYHVDEWDALGLFLEATFTPLAYGAHWLPGVGSEHQERVLAFDRMGSNGVHLSDRSTGRVRLARDGSLRISYRLLREDAGRLAFGIARAAEIWFAAGAREVYPGVAGSPVLRPGELESFEARRPRPRELRLEGFHPMGTARIGPDGGGGVTDADGSVHGREALYVADASLLPTPLGVNPMMTIVAVAARISRRIAERLA